MMNKKTLLVGSGLTFGALFLLQYLFSSEIISCGSDVRLTCYFFLQHLSAFGFGLLPLFVLSVVTYFMKESVSNAWIKLAYIYLFLLAVATSTSSSTNGGYVGSSDLSYALLFIIPIFIISSIILIIWKYLPLPYKGPASKN